VAFRRKNHELQEIMQHGRIDICAVSETLLSPNIPLNICKFATYYRDRFYTGGGGIAALIKRGIQLHLIALPALQGNEPVGVTLYLARQGFFTVISTYNRTVTTHVVRY
jgi:hypothetical protein